jgi:enoyl-CoA hydratase/3-hydroxyacyl-CoA dehydrogenase
MQSTRPVRVLAVIGAGNMGSGIAQKAATEGFPVILVDVDDAQVARGLAIIEKTLADGVERKIFRPDDAKAIRERITGTADWSKLEGADLVVEAVFEDSRSRSRSYRAWRGLPQGRHPRDEHLVVSVTDLARYHPERMIGLHFFYHPRKPPRRWIPARRPARGGAA